MKKIFKLISFTLIVIFLMIMVIKSWADEPEVIKWSDQDTLTWLDNTYSNYYTITPKSDYEFRDKDNFKVLTVDTGAGYNGFNMDKFKVNISCPDGYILVGSMWNKNGLIQSSNNGFWGGYKQTDAELKCVEE